MESPSLGQAFGIATEAARQGVLNGVNVLFGQAGSPATSQIPAPAPNTAAPGIPASAPASAGSAGSATDPNGITAKDVAIYGAIAFVAILAIYFAVKR